jgi:hypothetical protein
MNTVQQHTSTWRHYLVLDFAFKLWTYLDRIVLRHVVWILYATAMFHIR